MRAGLPVVASGVGGVSEAVVDGETVFLVPSGDAEQFGRRIESLLADPALRERMGSTGRRAYEAEFMFERMLNATRALYDGILAEATGTRDGSP
ncbi:MAG: hypothetical protein B7X11_04865, partial [Acidobacteria bacterium 37-65-4]